MRPVSPIQPVYYPASCFKPAEKKNVLDSKPVNEVSGAVGAQGVAQSGTRAAAIATRGTRTARVADVLSGESTAIRLAAERTAAGLTRLAGRVSPGFAAGAQRLAPVAMKSLSGAAHLAAKFGAAVGVPLAGYDVYKAVKEDDPTAKRAATANATLSVAGTALGTVGALSRAGGASVPLLVGSAAIGALQLVDSYVCDGQITQHLGDAGARTWQEMKA